MEAPIIKKSKKSSYELIKPIVESVDRNIKRQRWSNEKLEKRFAKRNAREIIDEGDTHYISPCLDLTLVTLQLLKEKGFSTTFLIEQSKSLLSKDTKLHFVVEFNNGEGHINYNIINNVIISGGSYLNLNQVRSINLSISRIDGKNISYSDNLGSILNMNSLEELNSRYLEFSFQKKLTKMKRKNTTGLYEKYVEFWGYSSNWNISEL